MKPERLAPLKYRMVSTVLGLFLGTHSAMAALSLPDTPLFVSSVTEPPLVLITMGRDHKLFYEAYNDASDLNDDGQFDVGYDPANIDYFGYFDSFKCYEYDSTDGRFEPTTTTADKTCAGGLEWSGDFLNYVTTARMDAIRGVLYGGYRSTDTASDTTLERTHVPQDAHSWGKEYNGIAAEGYDIQDYSPLPLPGTGKRHLLANTTLRNSGAGEPRLRILTNTDFRVWEWLSIERPVADSQCGNPTKTNCVPSGGGSAFSIVPASGTDGLSGLFREAYDCGGGICTDKTPDDKAEMDTTQIEAINPAGIPPNSPLGSDTPTIIDFPSLSDATPDIYGFGQVNEYFTIITGTLNVSADGTYKFAVDGDDAIDFAIDINSDGDFDDAGEIVTSFYGPHGFDGSPNTANTLDTFLFAGSYNIRYRHTEDSGGSGYQLFWIPASGSAGGPTTLTDLFVRVQVCVPGLLESNCKQYPNGNYKPTGILHDFGETDKMKFGLLTGSYAKNLSGGVLRKTMGSFTDEIDANDGTFTSTVGIVKTVDRFRELGFNTSYTHGSNCGFIFTRPFNEGECRWWGNPIGEMMYEGLRYFAGKGTPTSDFNIPASSNDDATLGLPLAAWDDPYDPNTGANECAKPMQLVISDINPSYDTDKIPGVDSNFGSFSGDISGLDVQNILDNTVSPNEPEVAGSHFIGQVGSTFDGAPTPKTVTSLGNIRGLAPEEPTKQGGYYSAAIAYHGLTTDVSAAAESQNINTLAVAIASPLPQFEIPVAGSTVTLVPFAKSVGGAGISTAQGNFQPTNTIVDFYIEDIRNTNASNADASFNGGLPYYKFRINYEDAEQGADHDMDAISEYILTVNDNALVGDTSDDTLSVQMNSVYAAGSVIQHMGYIISGTTADGTYLEVRDTDTGAGSDRDYFLDTPNVAGALPLSTSRTFIPGSAGGATLLKDPLWYAAKWGSFVDENDNDIPDLASEWDEDGDGIPDSYFLVTNAGKLKQQLENAFTRITELIGASASSVAINSTVLRTNSRLYQATFNTTDWSGELRAFTLNPDATIDSEAWAATDALPAPGDRNIFTTVQKTGVDTAISFDDTDADLVTAVGSGALINYIRGDQSNEQQNGGFFRDRSVVLGDIVNASPISISNQNFGYDFLPDATESSLYPAYVASKGSTFTGANGERFSIVIAGANDGMLHAFIDSTDTVPSTAGKEIFAYVPSMIHGDLPELADLNYSHRFFVDGTPHSSDAFINGAWTTMLVAHLGYGGRGLFALDISDPENFTASDVMWEFDSNDSAELGHVLHSPVIAKLNNGDWGVIFGNGYNSASQTARLFILNATDGSVIKIIDTEVGSGASPNGLAQPFLLDSNNDRIVDIIYAGDLQGNIWKFDMTGNASNWGSAFKQGNTPEPLYTATDDNGTTNTTADDTVQPITTRPVAVNHPDGGFMVLFGTGKYLENGDNTIPNSPQTQTFYGIHDPNQSTGNPTPVGTGRTDLVEQEILDEVDVLDDNNDVVNRARIVSDNTVNYSTQKGWYLDLISPINGSEAERVIANPLARFGRVIFTTFIPSGACEEGGDATIMEIDAVSGARLENSVFDFNNDGVIDADDFVTYGGTQVPGSGIYIPATLASPAVITADDASQEYKLTSGISGEITTTLEATGAITVGRQSWRQLR